MKIFKFYSIRSTSSYTIEMYLCIFCAQCLIISIPTIIRNCGFIGKKICKIERNANELKKKIHSWKTLYLSVSFSIKRIKMHIFCTLAVMGKLSCIYFLFCMLIICVIAENPHNWMYEKYKWLIISFKTK